MFNKRRLLSSTTTQAHPYMQPQTMMSVYDEKRGTVSDIRMSPEQLARLQMYAGIDDAAGSKGKQSDLESKE